MNVGYANVLRRLSPACVFAVLLLNACGSAGGATTPTLDADAIYTAAYYTLSAQQASQPSQTPATGGTLPAPLLGSASPSLAVPIASPASAPTLSPGGSNGCDNSTFVADVTIPDGTLIAEGAKFTKTWSLLNSGSCAWTSGYKLSFDSGEKMGGSSVLIGGPAVEPGQQTEISVGLVAPTAPGTYTSTWRMQNALGQAFGIFPYVQINVGVAAECRRSSRTQVKIAGDVGPENVTIDYGDGTVVSDLLGKYSITVPAGWSGTVTPISGPKVHPWTFTPAHRTYTNLMCDMIHEKFIATAPPGS